ncbi:MAG: hypothetical protein JXB48_03495 [Candidatus Latescibacteria bacterium]|nr:hypothetical protein [Candidatus Latescibacterota bacterium]
MKRFILIVLLNLAITDAETVAAGENNMWKRFVPDHVKSQFAGNIGFMSFGAGYSFFDGKLQSDLFYGFVDHHQSWKDIHHITQKNTYLPFTVSVNDELSWKPVTFGTHFCYKVGNNNYETWFFLPDRYPDKYYFPTAFHILLTVGTHLIYKNPGMFKNTGVYMEAGTSALYLRNWITQDYVKLKDIVSLDIGITQYFE